MSNELRVQVGSLPGQQPATLRVVSARLPGSVAVLLGLFGSEALGSTD